MPSQLPVKNMFLKIQCTELNWNKTYENGFFVYIFFKDMGGYVGVIGNLHNDECLIYIFTDGVLNDTLNMFNKSDYYCWYKEVRIEISPVLNNSTHDFYK